jgi:PAS domain S-box-containing protein
MAGFLLAIICTLDLVLPEHIAVGSLYLFSLVLLVNEERRTIIVFAAIDILLIGVETIYNYSGNNWLVGADKIISACIVVVTAFILVLNKKKAEEIIEQEKLFHDTLDNMMEGVQIISDDWKYEYINRSAVVQAKISREQLVGRTMMECYPGIENSPLFPVLEDCKRNRKRRYFENEFVYPDGSKGWFELSIQPIERGLFILSIDITERKMQEQLQREYVQGLEQLVFMISHKVRSPVANIMGIAHLLDIKEHAQEELKTISGHMKASAESLDGFTKEIGEYLTELQGRAKGWVDTTMISSAP